MEKLPSTPAAPQEHTRRVFLGRVGKGAVALGTAGTAISLAGCLEEDTAQQTNTAGGTRGTGVQGSETGNASASQTDQRKLEEAIEAQDQSIQQRHQQNSSRAGNGGSQRAAQSKSRNNANPSSFQAPQTAPPNLFIAPLDDLRAL